MRRILFVIAMATLLAGTAAASEPDGKFAWVGGGAYAAVFQYDAVGAKDETFQGFALTGGNAPSKNFAFRGHLYFTSHEDDSDIKLKGFDVQAMFGGNLDRMGFRYYLCGGYWSEELSSEVTDKIAFSEDFSGLMVGFGIGYAWQSVTLDWWGAARAPGPYEDFFTDFGEENPGVTHGAGGLTLSIRL